MDNYAHAADVVRRRDRDRYLADLYAPPPARGHLFALHAFAAEIARVREMVSEPALGEIRLQWWRDTLAHGDASGHPIAAAVLETVRRVDLPVAALDRMIAARVFDLYDDPMRTLADLEGYAGETAAALMQLTAIVLAGGRDPASADASGHGGVGETLVSVLAMLGSEPRRAAKYLPDELLDRHRITRAEIEARAGTPAVLDLVADIRALAGQHLDQAAAAVAGLPAELAPAYLPLAVAAARLARLRRHPRNPFASGDVPAWRRQWIIWRAARGRVRRERRAPDQPAHR
jgi:phytoene synthase